MNLHTFKDAVNARKQTLAHDLDEDDDEVEVAAYRGNIEGEEDAGEDKFNEIGEVIEPFNLRNERETGHFDENMNFVFKKERGEVDAWLADLDEATMEQGIGEAARALKVKQDKLRQIDDAADRVPRKSEMELEAELLTHMKPRETVAQAMRRISASANANASSAGNSSGGKNKQGAKGKNNDGASKSEDRKALRAAVERITELADDLLANGLSGVYDMTYEAIKASTVRWEYQGQDGAIHGPYTSQEIATWKAQGYFTGPTAVLMRTVGVLGQEWASAPVTASSRTSQAVATASATSASSAVDSSADVSSGARPASGSRVRFQLDNDKEEDGPVAKRVKTDAEDLLDDLDDDDDEDEDNVKSNSKSTSNNKGAVGAGASASNGQQSSGGGGVSTAVRAGAEDMSKLVRGPWISSDDVDFGEFIELGQAYSEGNGQTGNDSDEDEDGDEDGDGDDGDYKGNSRLGKRGRAGDSGRSSD